MDPSEEVHLNLIQTLNRTEIQSQTEQVEVCRLLSHYLRLSSLTLILSLNRSLKMLSNDMEYNSLVYIKTKETIT